MTCGACAAKDLIRRSQRYELTDEGRRIAVFFTKTYTRVVNPSLAELDPQLPDGDRAPITTGAQLARLRTRARGPNFKAGRYRGRKT